MGNIRQRDLFDAVEDRPSPNASATARVAGLVYVPNFIAPDVQTRLVVEIDAQPWMTELRRRVQHYGYRYDYRSRSVDRSMRLGKLPSWALAVVEKLQDRGLVSRPPDQLIVNEYEPGQGISNHIDCKSCFDGNVASLTLGSSCVMNLTHRSTRDVVPVLLEPGSVSVLTGEARYAWMHGISGVAKVSGTNGTRIVQTALAKGLVPSGP
jgi:alkylated DNA repair dioxygenase AlkB